MLLKQKNYFSDKATGYRHGNFYSTPAVAYGRVYIGTFDGILYCFGL